MTVTETNSAAQVARARRTIPGGVNSSARQVPGIEDITIASTGGAYFTDGDGRRYLDFHSAYGPHILGHCDPYIDYEVKNIIGTVDLMGVGVTDVEIELAEKLANHIPSAERVLLCASGSEATSYAIRLSRAVTGRKYLLKFQGHFHGWHDHVAMNVISPADKIGVKDPLTTGILPEIIDSTLVIPFNDITAVEEAFATHAGQIAAVILEPIPHNIGTVMPNDGFLQSLRDITTREGSVLIFDEVVTGFRHGLGCYQKLAGVTPDLTTLGKAMANGYPIASLVGRADLMDEWNTIPGKPVLFAGTYNGHPAMTMAALATVTKMEDEPVQEHVFDLGQKARDGLTELYKNFDVPTVVTGYGSVFLTYFMEGPVDRYEDLLRNDADLYCGYRLALMEHGVFELPINLKRSCFSYAHTEEHVGVLLDATEKAVTKVLAERGRG